MIAYGPVPSRRLGQSLGINNIPPKACTYSCVYCQVGRTLKMQSERTTFYDPDEISAEVTESVERATAAGERIDYLTLVPDGEPTLDIHLGEEIEMLRPLGRKIAVITNASLVSRPDVAEELMRADWVSVKVDTVREETWRRHNRPHRSLDLDTILDGLLKFAEAFTGELATETMLVADLNDSDGHATEVADFLSDLSPAKAYVSIPTRPPAEDWVRLPSEHTINRYYQIIAGAVAGAEYLIGYEGNAFASTGNVAEDILSITAVHPMRQQAVQNVLERTGADWAAIEELIDQDKLVETDYEGHTYYIRRTSAQRAH
ncbi:MAG: radical SAM protein [Armatimonadota bacterium]|nr:radical SAM protein [Armatimonadota bacterium]